MPEFAKFQCENAGKNFALFALVGNSVDSFTPHIRAMCGVKLLDRRNSEELMTVFPLSRFFSANRRFVGARANNFWQYGKQSFTTFDKFVKI